MPRGGRGADHAAHVGAGRESREDAGVSGEGGAGVRAGDAGLRAGEREHGDDARDRAGDGPADGGQPALDARAARADRHLPRVHPGVQPGHPDAQAVHRVLRRHGAGERHVLQHGHRRGQELDGSGSLAIRMVLVMCLGLHSLAEMSLASRGRSPTLIALALHELLGRLHIIWVFLLDDCIELLSFLGQRVLGRRPSNPQEIRREITSHVTERFPLVDTEIKRVPSLHFTSRHTHRLIYTHPTGHLRFPRGLVAAQGVQARALPADQGTGGRVRGACQVDSGTVSLLSLGLAHVHVLDDKGLEERVPEAVEDGVRAGGRDEGLEQRGGSLGFARHGTWRITTAIS